MAKNITPPPRKFLAFSLSAICAISLIPAPALAAESNTDLPATEALTEPEDENVSGDEAASDINVSQSETTPAESLSANTTEGSDNDVNDEASEPVSATDNPETIIADQAQNYDDLIAPQQGSFLEPMEIKLGSTNYGTITGSADDYYGIYLPEARSYTLLIAKDVPVDGELRYGIVNPYNERIKYSSFGNHTADLRPRTLSFSIDEPGLYRIYIGSNSTLDYHFSVSSPGLMLIDGNRYYYLADGSHLTGWQNIGGKQYYFSNKNGAPAKGLVVIDGKRYYFGPSSNVMATGWQTIGGKRYYFSTVTGAAAKGIATINGATYYFGSSSNAMATGWQTIGGKRYYFSTKNGKSASGLVSIGGYRYYFGAKSHAAATGWQKIGGYWYYFSSKTNRAGSGLAVIDGKRYYFNPSTNRMATGWQKIGGYWYYFSKNTGAAAKGNVTIDGTRYYFDPVTNRMR